jgi:hypothetical protein
MKIDACIVHHTIDLISGDAWLRLSFCNLQNLASDSSAFAHLVSCSIVLVLDGHTILLAKWRALVRDYFLVLLMRTQHTSSLHQLTTAAEKCMRELNVLMRERRATRVYLHFDTRDRE